MDPLYIESKSTDIVGRHMNLCIGHLIIIMNCYHGTNCSAKTQILNIKCMQEGDSSPLDQAPAFFDMVWLICVSDIPVKPTRLQSLSSHSSFWPYHSSEGRGSSIHGHFDEIKEREALTSVLICSIVEPWKCKLLTQKSEWIQDADQGKVNFFPVSSPVSQQILNADPKCWGEEMKWGGEKKQQQKKKTLTFFMTLSKVSGRLMSKQMRTASESGYARGLTLS